MAVNAERVQRSLLFGQFDFLVDREEVSQAEIDKLKGLILQVADEIGPRVERISHTFVQYTKHDMDHLCNVADMVYRFLPKGNDDNSGDTSTNRLNALELAILWLAILLHDTGMAVTDTEKQALLDSDSYKSYLRHNQGKAAAIETARAEGQTVKARAIEDALLAEYYRRIHGARASDFIRDTLTQKVDLSFQEVPFVNELCKVCESHNWGVLESNNAKDPNQCVKALDAKLPIGPVRVNLQYLACCLRLGDILDFDRSRTPLSVYEEINFTETISVQEWNKHLSIMGWTIHPHSVVYRADCTEAAYYVAVQDFLGWVDAELRNCHYLLEDQPEKDAHKYALYLPHIVDRRRVKMADPRFIAGGFRFRLEYEEIMKLLMDKSLYPSSALFLRELLQNALDACRYQKAMAADPAINMADKYVPRIKVWDYSQEKENPRIVFQDNGVGMSRNIVENYFLRVGKSYYRSAEFKAEQERLAEQGIHLDACSQFGIGFLSCFLGGDKIEVETYRYGSVPLKVMITGPSKYFLIEKQDKPDGKIPYNSPVDASQDGPPMHSGTRVTVYLKEGWYPEVWPEKGIVWQTLDAFAVNQEFDLEVVLPGDGGGEVIEKLRWEGNALPFGLGSHRQASPFNNVSQILCPSRVPTEKWEFSKMVKGDIRIWMLRDENGAPIVERGNLAMRDGRISINSSVLSAIAEINSAFDVAEQHDIIGPSIEQTIELLENISTERTFDWQIETPLEFPPESGIPQLDSSIYKSIQSNWNSLSPTEREQVINGIKDGCQFQAHDPAGSEWYRVTNLPEILLINSPSEVISKCLNIYCDLSSRLNWISSYQLALFGIHSPAKILTWEPQNGSTKLSNFLPKGVTGRMDIYGNLAPQPSASRLFVPTEKSGELKVAIGRAVIRHAMDLFLPHKEEEAWQRWIADFLGQCDEISEAGFMEFDLIKDHIQIKATVGGVWKKLSLQQAIDTFGEMAPSSYWGNPNHISFHWILKNCPTTTDGINSTIDLRPLKKLLNG